MMKVLYIWYKYCLLWKCFLFFTKIVIKFHLPFQKKENILASFKPLQRGIAACLTCPNPKVIRTVHALLSRLMSIFPTESATSNMASKHEELESLYACVSKVVYDGLSNYEKWVCLLFFPSSKLSRWVFSILIFDHIFLERMACSKVKFEAGWKIHRLVSYLLLMTLDQWDPSTAILREKCVWSTKVLLKNKPNLVIFHKSILVSLWTFTWF